MATAFGHCDEQREARHIKPTCQLIGNLGFGINMLPSMRSISLCDPLYFLGKVPPLFTHSSSVLKGVNF